MLSGFLNGLFVAWILSWFNIDSAIVEVLQALIPTIKITTQHYYILLGLIGCVGGMFSYTNTKHHQE